MIATAIVISGLINNLNSNNNAKYNDKIVDKNNNSEFQTPTGVDNIKPITFDDHILGSPDAPVIVVEFSDLECPFCKKFHPIMNKIVRKYNGKVSWVYRHFPLDSLHSKARKEAEASECATEQGGNDAFWRYINRIFEITPSNNGLDFSKLKETAEYMGLDVNNFISCLNSGKYANKIEKNIQDAIESGGRGTPYSVVITKSGQKFTIDGAQPYSVVKSIIDNALSVAVVK